MTGDIMSKLLEWARWLWLETNLAAPPIAQKTMIPRLREAKELARLLLRPYLTVYQWRGQGQGGPLVVNYAGTGDAKSFLQSELYAEEPVEIQIDRVPFWRINELSNPSTNDITIIEANSRLIHRLPNQNTFIMPVFIEMLLDVQGDWEVVKGHFRKSVQKERQRVKAYGYQYAISRSDLDFKKFYHDMYRHGAEAVLMSEDEAYQYFRHGLLFLVERDGQRVSGGVCHLGQDTVRFIVIGVINGDQQLIKEGAIGALNYLRIQWANQSGYKTIDLGYQRPVMGSLFHNKRKWGTLVKAPLDLKQQIWLKLWRNTPAVYQFMKDTQWLVMNKEHQLYGLVTTDAPETAKIEHEAEWRKNFETPGLKGMLIRSMPDFFDGTAKSIFDVNPATSIVF